MLLSPTNRKIGRRKKKQPPTFKTGHSAEPLSVMGWGGTGQGDAWVCFNLVLNFKITFIYLFCVCMCCMYGHMNAVSCMWRPGDNLQGLFLSFSW